MFIERITVPEPTDRWPFTVPAIGQLAEEGLELTTPVTFVVGANGSGKSTFVEALAEAANIDVEGGLADIQYRARQGQSPLGQRLQLSPRPPHPAQLAGDAQPMFHRSETALAAARRLAGATTRGHDEFRVEDISHGEGYLQVLGEHLRRPALFLLDEPEAPLSFQYELALVRALHDVERIGGQVVCATHSPVLTAVPGATILQFDEDGIRRIAWDELDVVEQYRSFLDAPDRFLRHLLAE